MQLIEDFVYHHRSEIQKWIDSRIQDKVFYSSCDVRYAGFKIAQVDSNCFPAGFNNLPDFSTAQAIELYKLKFTQKKIKKVLIYPEFHTRNTGYLNNLLAIKNILSQAGAEVKIASNHDQSFEANLESGSVLKYHSIERINEIIKVKNSNFIPDLIVLNNDLSKGQPEILKNISIPISNSPKLGWWNRLKTHHFHSYSRVIEDFAQSFNIDPWLFDSYFESISEIDFKNPTHEKTLNDKIASLYNKILKKYQEYNITKKPVIFLKSDRGTYGMGIHVIKNPEDGLNLNKNIRKKMDVIKDGVKNTSVIIQEGVETSLTQNGKFLEPVVYSAYSQPIGIFFRMNGSGDTLSNLNSKGMEFINTHKLEEKQKYLFYVISSFANIAITNEINSL